MTTPSEELEANSEVIDIAELSEQNELSAQSSMPRVAGEQELAQFEFKLKRLLVELRDVPKPHYVEITDELSQALIGQSCPEKGFNYRGFTLVKQGTREEVERRARMTMEEKAHGRP